MIKGLIDADGSHNYPLNDTLTRQMLLSVGQSEMLQNRKVEEWEPIVSWCNAHPGNFSFEESQKLESFATEAEGYIDSIKHINIVREVLKYSISDKYPLTAIVSNLLYSEDSAFNRDLAKTQFSSDLDKVTIPVLLLWGKYDFTCPPALGEDFYNRISSADKRMVLSKKSGHDMMLQDEELFCNEINDFVFKHK
jgi:pimeloyl-ACP methyl ester carboxylesterase